MTTLKDIQERIVEEAVGQYHKPNPIGEVIRTALSRQAKATSEWVETRKIPHVHDSDCELDEGFCNEAQERAIEREHMIKEMQDFLSNKN